MITRDSTATTAESPGLFDDIRFLSQYLVVIFFQLCFWETEFIPSVWFGFVFAIRNKTLHQLLNSLQTQTQNPKVHWLNLLNVFLKSSWACHWWCWDQNFNLGVWTFVTSLRATVDFSLLSHSWPLTFYQRNRLFCFGVFFTQLLILRADDSAGRVTQHPGFVSHLIIRTQKINGSKQPHIHSVQYFKNNHILICSGCGQLSLRLNLHYFFFPHLFGCYLMILFMKKHTVLDSERGNRNADKSVNWTLLSQMFCWGTHVRQIHKHT